MSSKALALCNVKVCEAYECACAAVCMNMCKCVQRGEHSCEYKRFTMERVRAGCVQQGGEGVLGVYLCMSVFECAHTDTCLCEFNFCSSCLQGLVTWGCFNLLAVWCKLKQEDNKQDCSKSRCVIVCLLYLELFCLFLSLCMAFTNQIELLTIMNCTVSVRLGKIMIIKYTVIDLAVFRHIQYS